MSPAAKLKRVKQRFPELKEFSRPQLRLVERAILFASRLDQSDELLSEQEHHAFIRGLPDGEIASSGRSLRAYRVRQDLTQAELAHQAGVPQGNISAMENGKRVIGLKTAKKLARLLNCDYRRLV